MIVIGIACAGASDVSDILTSMKVKHWIYDGSSKLPKKPVLLMQVQDFEKYRKLMQKNPARKHQRVLVFGPVVRLSEYEGLIPLNFTQHGIEFRFIAVTRALLTKALASTPANPGPIKKDREPWLPKVIQMSTEGSFLSPLLTITYALAPTPAASLRAAIFAYMKQHGKPWFPPATPAAIQKQLKQLMQTEIAGKFAQAMRAIGKAKGKTPPFQSVAKKYDVTPYELRYAVKVIRVKHPASNETPGPQTLRGMFNARANSRGKAASRSSKAAK